MMTEKLEKLKEEIGDTVSDGRVEENIEEMDRIKIKPIKKFVSPFRRESVTNRNRTKLLKSQLAPITRDTSELFNKHSGTIPGSPPHMDMLLKEHHHLASSPNANI